MAYALKLSVSSRHTVGWLVNHELEKNMDVIVA
jgi:hypothetical protein